ncbi:MAG: FAD-dependent oxidoreductase [Anaerolineales bacterium]
MPDKNYSAYTVVVIGAGPAGLFAARQLANSGVQVALLNRDIKAGGLAEYGIYPDKLKMKNGLRRQFRKILDLPNLEYFGNLPVSLDDELSLTDLQAVGFDAILVTVGAQGTKRLGLPGEELPGVHHAKDLVYYYNHLPPFSQQSFPIGKRVACIGVGNVMMDIAHWGIRALKVDEVIAIARRGPGDVKFAKQEMEIVARNLDLAALDAEFERTAPVMRSVGQDPEAAKTFITSALERAEEPVSETRFSFQFLASPNRMLADERGHVRAIEVENTDLVAGPDSKTKSVDLGTFREIPCDTVVFCIGDRVDAGLGLPLDKWGDYAKNPKPRFPVDETSYEAYNPELQQPLEGVFLAGWARLASNGLVGTARKDGTNAALAVISYLETTTPKAAGGLDLFSEKAAQLENPIVDKTDLTKLEAVEAARAAELKLPEFKFDSNEEMLAAIGKLQREKS